VSGCKDEVVGPIIRGSYTLQEKNHERPVFKKDEKVGPKAQTEVMLYFWEDQESPDFSGWWFGPQIGGDEVWAFHPDATAMNPPTTGWQCPFDGPVDSSIEIVTRLTKGAAVPGRQPGTSKVEKPVPILSKGEQAARRKKELELMSQQEEISRQMMTERERLAIQRKEELQQRQQFEVEQKKREHHALLLLKRSLQKLRLAKPETLRELTAEVDEILLQEAMLLPRSMRQEADKVKHEAKIRVAKISQFNQRVDAKKRVAEESRRKYEEASKKLIEQLEQLVEVVETVVDNMEDKLKSLEGPAAFSDEDLENFSESLSQTDEEASEAFRSAMAFVTENRETMEEVEFEGKPGKEQLDRLIFRAGAANARRAAVLNNVDAAKDSARERRGLAVEAAERRSMAEALVEREKAVFKRYDSDGDDRMTIVDALSYAKTEFGAEVPRGDLERLYHNLSDRFGKAMARSLPFERFHDLKVTIGIAREVARDRQRQACKKERMTLLNLTASEVEVLFDKAEASCQKAKEDTEKLQELLEDGLLSSDMVEMCKQVKAVVESAEEELLIAKERAEELARGDASGILDDHRTESTRLLTRCGKPKSLIAAAKIALSQRERLVAVKRTAEVQELGKRARAALRAGSPKAQGTGTELLSGLGDPDGDPLDKDDVASFLRLQLESTTDDLVMAWLDFVTKGSDNNDIITREDIWTLIRICYKVVKSTVLTTDVSALDSTVLAKLEVNEVVELIGDEEPTMDEAADLHRVRVRRLRDGQEGWVTVRGNAGTVYLQLGGDRLSVAKETSLTESLSIGGQDALRQLRCGEILDIMGEETVDETTGLLRCRVRAQNDGKVGWATKVGNQGTIFLRQL